MSTRVVPVRPAGRAGQVLDLVTKAIGQRPPVRLKTWDGDEAGPPDAPATVRLTSPRALRRLVWAPNELGLARAYISGDLEIDGDLFAVLEATSFSSPGRGRLARVGLEARNVVEAAAAAKRLGALGPPVPPPSGEARLHGAVHSRRRDAAAISHHYDVGNDFYRLLLGESMTYSCAYWKSEPSSSFTLTDAQAAKHDLVARKLGLKPGMRLLDVGCGWGGMVMHAAANYGVSAVGVTLSREQLAFAKRRVAEAGFEDLIDVRLLDYRDIAGASLGPFDAISSIGMAEHVGAAAYAEYASCLYALLVDGGRLLNHQISKPSRHVSGPGSAFIERYIFPDGELLPVGQVIGVLERAGFEVRDVESLRENYTLTLLQWLANLRANRAEAVRLAGLEKTRTWELYIAGSAASFDTARIGIHQTLAIKTVGGRSGLPRVRADWLCGSLDVASAEPRVAP